MSSQKTIGKRNAAMADNQVAFRNLNSKLKKMIDELDEIAVLRGEESHSFHPDEVYQFYCECSDEDCLERIALRFDAYEKHHERDDTFTILQGHEVFGIEEVILVASNYCVVRKFETPKQSNETFHKTSLHNAST